jgi:glycine oxidase
MTFTSDIIIAGGGVIGLVAAHTLARAGLNVTLVDDGRPAATAAAAGMLAPTFERALTALEDVARESLDEWRRLAPLIEEETGVAVDLQMTGVLSVAFAGEERGDFPEDLKGGAPLSAKEVLALEPTLAADVAGGWFAGTDGQTDPRALMRALPAAIARHGGRLIRGQRVAGVEQEKGAVCGVRLSSGERLAAGAVIIATGARIEGLAPLPSGAVFPVKGEALALARGAASPSRVIRTRSAYLCPKADGRLVVGATEIAGEASLTTDAARIERLKNGAVRAAPALAASGEMERWAGLRPATADGLPVIGPAPDGPPGLLYALGHYRNGVLLAPATAAALTRVITRGEAPPAAFSAGRFNARKGDA